MATDGHPAGPLFPDYHRKDINSLNDLKYRSVFYNWRHDHLRVVMDQMNNIFTSENTSHDQVRPLYATNFFIGGITDYAAIAEALNLMLIYGGREQVITGIAKVLSGLGAGSSAIEILEERLMAVQQTWCREFRDMQRRMEPVYAKSCGGLREKDRNAFRTIISARLALWMEDFDGDSVNRLSREVEAFLDRWANGETLVTDALKVIPGVSMHWMVDNPTLRKCFYSLTALRRNHDI